MKVTRLLAGLLGACALASAAGEKDQAYHKLIHEFMAPCCWKQRLDVHDSPLAAQVRARIKEQLAAGQSGEQIRQSMVEEFGVRVLPEPPGKKAAVLYAMPFVALGAGTVAVAAYIRARRRRGGQPEVDEANLPDVDID